MSNRQQHNLPSLFVAVCSALLFSACDAAEEGSIQSDGSSVLPGPGMDAAPFAADGGASAPPAPAASPTDAAGPFDAGASAPSATPSREAGAPTPGAGPTRSDAGTPSADAGPSDPDGSQSDGGCPHVQLKGADVCTIGDSWIQLPGNQVTTLENHMKKAGVLPMSDRFDRREVSGSTLSSIIATYNRKPMNCKILIMDGGGIDLFVVRAGDQASIAPVVKQFKDFLQKLKTDGFVQHIIYSLYPVIPSTANLNVNMKPGFSEACAASEVDCHLVDLEPLFMGRNFASDQTHANDQGGVIIGDAWWKAMQENCIAQ